MRNKIKDRAERAIQEKVFPGCVIGVVRKNGDRTIMPFGNFTYESDSQKVMEDTVYDLASVTKSIPAASLALTLISEGKFRARDAVREYLPELKNDYGATVEDLLTYRVKGTRLSTLHDKTPDEILGIVFQNGFEGVPGRAEYTNLPALLVGLIVERVGDDTLQNLAQKYFFEPLGTHDTTFFPADISRVPPTEVVGGSEVCGIVHDESARIFAFRGRAVGHAGLFSTAPDILNFLEALLAGKLPAVLAGAKKGFGWQRAESWFMGSHFGEGSFGKTGFTGTSVAVDPERDVAFVILSNRTYPQRPPDAASIHSAINTFRADIADILLR
ncbi:class A beta-lactamase-related serine hydrolase [Candidatus Kaiserbacteria bacterium]|nr:class A beta-lactamase-related serine hydrolase [Candidatus Kaiserbacteria bacterium]